MRAEAEVPPALIPHQVFRGGDLDEALDVTTRWVNPHTARLLGESAELDVRFLAASVGSVTLAYLGWGADVEIRAPDPATCFCVQLPLRGAARIECGRDSIISDSAMLSVPTPVEPLRMHWKAGSAQLILRVEGRRVEDRLQEMLGDPLHRGPIRMPLGVAASDGAWTRWLAVFELVKAEVAMRDEVQRTGVKLTGLSAATIEDLVLNGLLLWHPNNYTDRLTTGVRPARAPYVRNAMEYIRENIDSPLTIATIARAAGVSVRALQVGFARDLGMAPSAYIRDLRLDRVRDELRQRRGEDGLSVTDVASRWGFTHLGRMSRYYRRRFDELPSQTIRSLLKPLHNAKPASPAPGQMPGPGGCEPCRPPGPAGPSSARASPYIRPRRSGRSSA